MTESIKEKIENLKKNLNLGISESQRKNQLSGKEKIRIATKREEKSIDSTSHLQH